MDATPTPVEPTEYQPSTGRKILYLILKIVGFAIVTFVLSLLLGGLMSYFAFDMRPVESDADSLDDWKGNSLINIGIAAAALLSAWFFRVRVDKLPFETLGFTGGRPFFDIFRGGLWAVLLLTMAFLILWMAGWIGVSTGNWPWVDVLGFMFFFLLISIVEEVLFRGYLMTVIAKDFSMLTALVVSALLFGIMHLGNADFTWLGFASIVLGGYVIGLLMYKYQTIYVAIGMHWFWNFYHGNVLGFDVSGFDVPALLDIQMRGPDMLTGGEFGLEGSLITILLLTAVSIHLSRQMGAALFQTNLIGPSDTPATPTTPLNGP